MPNCAPPDSKDCSIFDIDCAQSGAQNIGRMHKLSRSGAKLVGLSNSLNRPKVRDLEDVHTHIFNSIVDQRLPPGTKLNELSLAEIFNVGRRGIVQVLQRLAYDGLVTLHRNRGAYVALPGKEEARAIFDARKVIEAETTRIVAQNATREKVAPLRRNVEAEAACRRNGQLREAIRLSGEFHILLGACAGNAILYDMVRQLVARTSLVVALYENQNTMMCWHDDHSVFLKLLEGNRINQAVAMMRRHLSHVEESLDLDQKADGRFDLRAIYAPPVGRDAANVKIKS
jgi:DNA-binding GntR family transcriptional regulator